LKKGCSSVSGTEELGIVGAGIEAVAPRTLSRVAEEGEAVVVTVTVPNPISALLAKKSLVVVTGNFSAIEAPRAVGTALFAALMADKDV
jgi:hypothetical protein